MRLADSVARFEANARRVMCVDAPPGQVGFGLSAKANKRQLMTGKCSCRRVILMPSRGEYDQKYRVN